MLDKIIQLSSENKKDELVRKYRGGDLDAAVMLLFGLTYGVEAHDEDFFDEETGITTPIHRIVIIPNEPAKLAFGEDHVLKAELESYLQAHKAELSGEAAELYETYLTSEDAALENPMPDDEPCEYSLKVRGAEEVLQMLGKFFLEHLTKFGTPFNECGMFIPLERIIETLHIDQSYPGNIMNFTRGKDYAEILIECNPGAAEILAEGLRHSFPEIDGITIKEL